MPLLPLALWLVSSTLRKHIEAFPIIIILTFSIGVLLACLYGAQVYKCIDKELISLSPQCAACGRRLFGSSLLICNDCGTAASIEDFLSSAAKSEVSARQSRRLVRFGMKRLLVLWVLACVLFSYLGIVRKDTRLQQNVLSVISTNAHIKTSVTYQFLGIANSSFGDVSSLALIGSVTNEDVERASTIHSIERLYVEGDGNANIQLSTIRDLHLTILVAIRANICDEELLHLKGIRALEYLDLRGNPITDKGIRDIANVQGLKFIDLRNTLVTDHGIQQLRNACPNLAIEY